MNINLIIDSICKLNNGIKNKKKFIKIFYSKFNIKFLNLLYKEGIINGYRYCYIRNDKLRIEIFLKYYENKSIFFHLKKISSASNRKYIKYKNLIKDYNINEILIISTSKGLFTNKYLFTNNIKIGGEIIASYTLC